MLLPAEFAEPRRRGTFRFYDCSEVSGGRLVAGKWAQPANTDLVCKAMAVARGKAIYLEFKGEGQLALQIC